MPERTGARSARGLSPGRGRYVPGQLANENRRRNQRILKVRSQLVNNSSRSPHAVEKLICRHEKKTIAAARIVHGHRLGSRCHSRPHRNRRGKDRRRADSRGPWDETGIRLKRNLDANRSRDRTDRWLASEFHAQREDGSCRCCPLSPSATTWTGSKGAPRGGGRASLLSGLIRHGRPRQREP